MELISKVQLSSRNSIDRAGLFTKLKIFIDSENCVISDLAKKIEQYWNSLEVTYKIPKISKSSEVQMEQEKGELQPVEYVEKVQNQSHRIDLERRFEKRPLPFPRPKIENPLPIIAPVKEEKPPSLLEGVSMDQIKDVIENAKKQKSTLSCDFSISVEEEKELRNRITEIVIGSLSKYKSQLETEQFKKIARKVHFA